MISPFVLLTIVVGYFGLLFWISRITGRQADNQTFFTGNRNSRWYLVAFGMIGTSLSGVTFISVPGWVATSQFSYLQMVLGYLLGYAVIAFVLMPLYYRMNLTSIYTYLEMRFGPMAYRTGAAFFLLSRTIGASFRMYLVAIVSEFILEKFGLKLPFAIPVAISITAIYLYTHRGGIQTVVWTDTLQTFFMLSSVGLTVFWITQELDLSASGMMHSITESIYSQVFFWESGPKNFFLQFFSGAFIAIVMTGLDQDMMQKNLTCRTLKEAQLNMVSFSTVLILVNLGFLALGALLYLYGHQQGILQESTASGAFQLLIQDKGTGEMLARGTDYLFPILAVDYMPGWVGILFILGLVAAAYSSADSALAALTTSFCVDFLKLDQIKEPSESMQQVAPRHERTRQRVQAGFCVILFLTILVFHGLQDQAIIAQIFKAAGFTYGPLLGLYAFGLLMKRRAADRWIPLVCVGAASLSFLLNWKAPQWLGTTIGFEILLYNGGMTFLGLWLISSKAPAMTRQIKAAS